MNWVFNGPTNNLASVRRQDIIWTNAVPLPPIKLHFFDRKHLRIFATSQRCVKSCFAWGSQVVNHVWRPPVLNRILFQNSHQMYGITWLPPWHKRRSLSPILKIYPIFHTTPPWAFYQIHKIAGCACARNVSPPPRVSDLDIHQSTWVTHVPWCMPGSLTSGFLWSWWQGKRSRQSRGMRNPPLCVSGKRPTDEANHRHMSVMAPHITVRSTVCPIVNSD